jgi:hypothetical protein
VGSVNSPQRRRRRTPGMFWFGPSVVLGVRSAPHCRVEDEPLWLET